MGELIIELSKTNYVKQSMLVVDGEVFYTLLILSTTIEELQEIDMTYDTLELVSTSSEKGLMIVGEFMYT